MAQLADYKVIKDSNTFINSNQSHSFNFTMADNVVQAEQAQRPFFMITETIAGALPGTISIELNGQSIEIREGSASSPLNFGKSNTHILLFNGSLLNVGTNTLSFSVTTKQDTRYDLEQVIVHFQREI